MNSQQEKTNILEFLVMLGMGVLFIIVGVTALLKGQLQLAGLAGLLILLVIFRLFSGLQQGIRPPTHYERFRAWMTLRPILVGGVGLGITMLIIQSPDLQTAVATQTGKVIAGIGAVLWLGLTIYFAIRAPYRTYLSSETDAEYKVRSGYREP